MVYSIQTLNAVLPIQLHLLHCFEHAKSLYTLQAGTLRFFPFSEKVPAVEIMPDR